MIEDPSYKAFKKALNRVVDLQRESAGYFDQVQVLATLSFKEDKEVSSIWTRNIRVYEQGKEIFLIQVNYVAMDISEVKLYGTDGKSITLIDTYWS